MKIDPKQHAKARPRPSKLARSTNRKLQKRAKRPADQAAEVAQKKPRTVNKSVACEVRKECREPCLPFAFVARCK